jgi:hypothetical protein
MLSKKITRITNSFNNVNKKTCKVNKINYCQDKNSGGHKNTIFSPSKDTCAKPTIINNPKNQEYIFYTNINKNSMLYQYLPKYYDICYKDNKPYMVLKNLKNKFEEPIDIDIKYGFNTASINIMNKQKMSTKFFKKIRHELLDLYTTTSKYGIRVEGINIDTKLTKLQLMRQNIIKTLTLYFSKDNDNKALDSFIYKLRIFINNINNDEFRNYLLVGSSILFIYDAKNSENTSFNIIDFNNSIILDKDEVKKYTDHADSNILAFTNLLNILIKLKIQKSLL